LLNTIKKVFCIIVDLYKATSCWCFQKSDTTFTTTGFAACKKAIEKFEIYENSIKQGQVKIAFLKGPFVSVQHILRLLNSKVFDDLVHLLIFLQGLQFLLCQEIVICGHFEGEQNLC